MAAITSPLVLAAGTSVTPVAELSPEMRSRLGAGDDAFVVSREGSRTYSVVVDEHAAILLRCFSQPTLIVDAVVKCSTRAGVEPDAALAAAYPLLRRCYDAGWLVPAGGGTTGAIAASLDPGTSFASRRVVRTIDVLDDTELYLLAGATSHAVLKIAREASARSPFANEIVALKRLAGTCAPAVIDRGSFKGRPWFVMEWCPGEPVWLIADEHRRAEAEEQGRTVGTARQGMLALAIRVLRAFATAHGKGVIHGDVHARNILVTADGAVHLVDFGLARVAHDPDAPRGGVAYFYEPELARAALASEPWPLASEAGEQYALGALLYSLFTGFHYCDFKLQRAPMMQQIANAEPLSFAERGVRPWLEVERVLQRALSKQPEERFVSVAEFADALARLQRQCPTSRRRKPERPPLELTRMTRDVLQRVAVLGELFKDGLSASPTASVCVGASGIAYGLYRLAVRSGDPALLADADLWSAQALRSMDKPEAFANAEIDLTPESVGTIAPLHAAPGLFVTEAFIAHAMDNPARRTRAVSDFLRLSRAPCDSLDLTLGRASTLLACASLIRIDRENAELRAYGTEVDREIWALLRALPPLAECTDIYYLGIAHGWAGLLYASLLWHEAAGTQPPRELGERLVQLAACGEPFGQGLRWSMRPPSVVATQDVGFTPGWCHGTAGYVHLWTAATRVLAEPRYLELAVGAATHSRRAEPVAGHLCCGAAGQAYAMLALYRQTQDQEWLLHAHRLARAAARHDTEPGHFTSLYRGALGVAVLAADLEAPQEAAMPFFEPERW